MQQLHVHSRSSPADAKLSRAQLSLHVCRYRVHLGRKGGVAGCGLMDSNCGPSAVQAHTHLHAEERDLLAPRAGTQAPLGISLPASAVDLGGFIMCRQAPGEDFWERSADADASRGWRGARACVRASACMHACVRACVLTKTAAPQGTLRRCSRRARPARCGCCCWGGVGASLPASCLGWARAARGVRTRACVAGNMYVRTGWWWRWCTVLH